MHAIEINVPIDLSGNIHLPAPYSYLYGQRARMVILLQSPLPPAAQPPSKPVDWPEIDPQRDLAQYIGRARGFPEDGVAYQRRIRDEEWS